MAWAVVLSLLAHVLALTGMIAGLKALRPRPEGRVLELSLLPAPAPAPHPEPAHRTPARFDVAEPLQRPATPRSSLDTRATLAFQAPTSQPDAEPRGDAGSRGMLPGLRGRLGCDDPAAFHLTMEERRACVESLARLSLNATPLNLNISDRKRAEYDNYERCLRLQQTVPIPSLDANDSAGGAEIVGRVALNVGMGNVPAGCLMGHW